MENFDRENIDELLEIRQIRQYFPPSKICAVRYTFYYLLKYQMFNFTCDSILTCDNDNACDIKYCIPNIAW